MAMRVQAICIRSYPPVLISASSLFLQYHARSVGSDYRERRRAAHKNTGSPSSTPKVAVDNFNATDNASIPAPSTKREANAENMAGDIAETT